MFIRANSRRFQAFLRCCSVQLFNSARPIQFSKSIVRAKLPLRMFFFTLTFLSLSLGAFISSAQRVKKTTVVDRKGHTKKKNEIHIFRVMLFFFNSISRFSLSLGIHLNIAKLFSRENLFISWQLIRTNAGRCQFSRCCSPLSHNRSLVALN